jgi:Protein of unknown function (DUF1353)
MKLHPSRTLRLLVVILLSGCAVIRQPVVKPFADGRDWVLMRPLSYDIPAAGQHGIVPQGFVTDFASIPRGLWSALPPYERYGPAAIVHDYLYWTQRCTREQADMAFREAMRESGVPAWKREGIYEAVKVGGEGAWQQNARDRRRGLLRIIPADRIEDIPPDATWPEFRKKLRNEPSLRHEPSA